MVREPFFGVGDTDIPATLSFLAPAQDQQRSISPNRRQSMAIIGGVIRGLRSELKGGIGLYDDAFNINCTGDTFQSLGIPTILFEAGHFPNDYERETTRFFVFKALKLALDQILKGVELDILEYENTPFNKKIIFRCHHQKYPNFRRRNHGCWNSIQGGISKRPY
jgi:hypothetical protein